MPLLLDTFNVLHTVGVLPPDLAGIDIAGLAALVGGSRYRNEKVTFVCDGLPHAGLPGQGPLQIAEGPAADLDLMIRYSGAAAPADDLIRDLVNASTAPRRLIVVSSDHTVQKHARRRRCIVLTSQEFLQQLADDASLPRLAPSPRKPIPRGMTDEQVQKWMRTFGVDDQTPALPEDLLDDLAAGCDDVASHLHEAEVDSAADVVPPEASPAIVASREPRTPLPADLIAEAEQLWQRAQPAKPSQPPAAASPPTTSAAPSPAAAGAPAASPDSRNAGEAPDTGGDPHAIDMNDILPPDGRTQPLRRRNNRHRPQ